MQMRFVLFVIFGICRLSIAEAQILYASTYLPTGNQILRINLQSCVATPLVDLPQTPLDMCIAPNGLFYVVTNSINISSVDSITGVVTPVATLPNIAASGLEWGEDGFLYAISHVIFKINPTTGVVQNMGQFPPGWVSTGELVYHNGIYYGAMNTPQGLRLVNVNLNNPSASTIITNMPLPFVGGGCINHPTCPKLLWIRFSTTGNTEVWEYDINTQAWSISCGNIPYVLGGGDTPNDYTFPITCPCTTNAGNVSAINFQNLCGTSATVTVPFSGGEVLDADDILRYILFENLSDPSGSILLQSLSPVFQFDPNTMNLGQNYYLATIAGNNLNGAVNIQDPCLDISNFIIARWNALPTVSFSSGQNEICEGQCQNLELSFTGTPPFNLVYNTPSGQQTAVFPGNAGTLETCPPSGFLGAWGVAAVSLTDLNCICE